MIGLLYVLIGSLLFVGALALIETVLGLLDDRHDYREINEPVVHVRIRPRPFDWERDWTRD